MSAMLVDVPVHYISAGGRQLLQAKRNTSGHQSGHLAHLKCNLRLKTGRRHLLLGRNGVGKTTLLRAVANGGLQNWPSEVTTFYVDWDAALDSEQTPLEVVLASDLQAQELRAEAASLTETILTSSAGDLVSQRAAERLCELYDIIELDDDGARESRACKILRGLGLDQTQIEQPLHVLSEGFRRRVKLAAGLFCSPDLLLLDEPTNHMDLETIEGLRKHLVEEFKGTLLCVSHDRAFINDLATDTIILEDNHLEYFNGTLDELDAKSAADGKHLERRAAALAKKKEHVRKTMLAMDQAAQRRDANRESRRDHTKKAPMHLGGRTSGSSKSSMVSQRLKKLDRMGFEKTLDGKRFKAFVEEGPRIGAANANDGGWVDGRMTAASLLHPDEPDVNFLFLSGEALALPDDVPVVEFRGVEYAHPGSDTLCLKNLEVPFTEQCRVAVTGRNGSGKSTFLRLFVGDAEATQGEILRQRGLRVGYLRQNEVEEIMHLSMTAVEHLAQCFPRLDDEAILEYLNGFGVTEVLASQALSTLSGGECMRVALARMSADLPHLLVLDEPTNHLDIQSIEALISALKDFQGGVIFASHNKHLIDQVAEEVISLTDGVATMGKAALEPEFIHVAGLKRSVWRESSS